MERFDHLGFATRAIHAGQDADPTTRGDYRPPSMPPATLHPGCSRQTTRGYEYKSQWQPHSQRRLENLSGCFGRRLTWDWLFASGVSSNQCRARCSCQAQGDEVLAQRRSLWWYLSHSGGRSIAPGGLVPKYTEDVSPAGFCCPDDS